VPRIVADTNIYISALNFAGSADKVLALGRAGLIEICISPAILDEIGGVLARKFRWSATGSSSARLPPEPTRSSPVTIICSSSVTFVVSGSRPHASTLMRGTEGSPSLAGAGRRG
jgi:hypothetical protein